jgi:monoterpene epsilon-lactone hydrolase
MNKDGTIADKSMVQEVSSNEAAASLQSRCIVALLRVLGVKRKLASAAAVQERVRKLALKPASYKPKGQGPGVTVTLEYVSGWPVYHMVPLTNPDTKNYVVFLHGGGYINEIVPAHWRFLGHLVREAVVRCIVPIYPVAPQGTAGDVVPAVGEFLQQLLADGSGGCRNDIGGGSMVERRRLPAATSTGAGIAWRRCFTEPGRTYSCCRP